MVWLRRWHRGRGALGAVKHAVHSPFDAWYLGGVWLASAVIYVIGLLLPFPLLRLYDQPHQYLGPLTDHDPAAALRYGEIMASLLLLYALGWWVCRQLPPTRWAWVVVLGGAVLLGVLLLFVHPFGAGDIYDYFFTGHIVTQYDANPYLTKPSQFESDPLYQYVGWQHKRSVYGPLWQLLGVGALTLAGPGLLAGLFAYKLVVLLSFVATLALIRVTLLRLAPTQALAGTYLFGWCPLVLIETSVNGHNDSVMVLCIVLCFLALSHRRVLLALAALSCATLVKYTALMFLPLVGLYLWLDMGRPALRDHDLAAAQVWHWRGLWRRMRLYLPDRASLRWRFGLLLRGTIGFAIPLVLLYGPFWQGWVTLGALNDHTNMWTASASGLIFYDLRGGMGKEAAGMVALRFSLVILALTYAALVLFQRRTGVQALIARCGALLWVYLLVCNPWFQPWYLIWLAALVALTPRSLLFWRTWAFVLGAFACYIFFSFPFFWEEAGIRSMQSQGTAVLVTYVPPLLVILVELLRDIAGLHRSGAKSAEGIGGA